MAKNDNDLCTKVELMLSAKDLLVWSKEFLFHNCLQLMAKNDNDLCTKVELMLSAKCLADKDFFSKSDPMCVVFEAASIISNLSTNHTKSSFKPNFVEVGRTAKISDCLNPEWTDIIRINYFFEMKQAIRFEIYDVDCKSKDLSKHDFLGSCECHLANIVAAPDSSLVLSLDGPSKKTNGQLIIRAKEDDDSKKENLFIVCHGRKLDKKKFLGKADPYLQFFRYLSDGSSQLVYQTEKKKNTLNPEWKPFEIGLQLLCNGNKDNEFLIKCYDYNFNGNHNLIGVCNVTVNSLTTRQVKNLTLINEKKQKKKLKNYTGSGVLHFFDVQLRREYTFLEFISAGLQLEFAVAIDFTASNGAVHLSTSLHYINSSALNQYETAISAVLEVCEPYNQLKSFESTGFGAKLPLNVAVSHLFPLDYSEHSNFRMVNGVSGVLNAYRKALNFVQLYGPTNFSPTINDYIYKTRQFPKDASRYQILLIITDGVITDMEKTKAAIIEASSLPISIIIIGVGSEDFSNMNVLDSDDELLTQAGRISKRDIVQFVPFQNFLKKNVAQNGMHESFLQTLLAKEVLAEVPNQVTSYMKLNNILPLPANVSGSFKSSLLFSANEIYSSVVNLSSSNQTNLQHNIISSAPPLDF